MRAAACQTRTPWKSMAPCCRPGFSAYACSWPPRRPAGPSKRKKKEERKKERNEEAGKPETVDGRRYEAHCRNDPATLAFNADTLTAEPDDRCVSSVQLTLGRPLGPCRLVSKRTALCAFIDSLAPSYSCPFLSFIHSLGLMLRALALSRRSGASAGWPRSSMCQARATRQSRKHERQVRAHNHISCIM